MKKFLVLLGMVFFLATPCVYATSPEEDPGVITTCALDTRNPPTEKQMKKACKLFHSKPSTSLKDMNWYDGKVSIRYPQYGTVLIVSQATFDAQQQQFAPKKTVPNAFVREYKR